jgi:hypothetical protein
VDDVETVLAGLGISSYSIYETFGSYDLLLRCWVPTNLNAAHVDDALRTSLTSRDLNSTDFFEVAEILKHWAWPSDLQLNDESIDWISVLPENELVILDQAKAASPRELSGGGEVSIRGESLLAEAERRGLIRSFGEARGIRVFIVVTTPLGSVTAPTRDFIRTNVTLHCQRLADSGDMLEWSLYAGHGFGELLLMARFDAQRFYPAARDLIYSIVQDPLVTIHRMRTFTAIGAEPSFQRFVDRVTPAAVSEEVVSTEVMLGLPESETLELKASAFTSIDRLVLGTGSARGAAEPAPQLIHGIAKNVCAFLNSREGGTILIGVLEREDYVRRHVREAPDVADRLLEMFGEPYGAGDRLVLGVGLDFGAAHVTNWDQYSLRLQAAVLRDIQPYAAPWVSLRESRLGDKTVARIDVRPMTRGWAYLVGRTSQGELEYHFWVREYGRAKEYSGPDADSFKLTALRGE